MSVNCGRPWRLRGFAGHGGAWRRSGCAGHAVVEEQAASLAWVLAGLVSNGGFEAWVESLGQRTPDAVVGLRLLGADGYAVLLEQVARLYPTLGAADADTRLSAMDDWGDREVSQLHQLTQQFFELQQAHDLEERFVAPFVRAYPRQVPLRVEDL